MKKKYDLDSKHIPEVIVFVGFSFQPYFGSKIVTPPSGRRPVPLLDHVSPPTADLHEGQDQHNDDPDMEVRGSGVGSDVDVEGMST